MNEHTYIYVCMYMYQGCEPDWSNGVCHPKFGSPKMMASQEGNWSLH